MISRYLSKRDLALDSIDLDTCQRAFDAIVLSRNIARETEEAEKVAAMIIELFREGIHDEQQLVELVGINDRHRTTDTDNFPP
ncbi:MULTISPECIES: hypothetical protein [Rhizobium]|uniref:tRNA A-37 threonylcarbamoyl transferase component Bud32 n=1 Tax=Rhizobium paranaense TaxID=1650438 RepID=A0A7W9D4X2_9HYPH|nr:hypothetical protein [Rhizobium paranaense]MBB5577909.1 tRNA A-37 threonylcarbamoyl transferase component Bud32 [Rhizobium paranaense]